MEKIKSYFFQKCFTYFQKNGTDSKERLRISRGIRKIEDIGRVTEFNGEKQNMTIWGDPRCDEIDGTDGSIFHPFFDKNGNDPLSIFVPTMCRTLRYRFHSKTQFYGNVDFNDKKKKENKEGNELIFFFSLHAITDLDALRYTTKIGIDGQNDPLDNCYCATDENCLKKGTFDMFKCNKLPLILSDPHFYEADAYYLSLFEGLEPQQVTDFFYFFIIKN